MVPGLVPGFQVCLLDLWSGLGGGRGEDQGEDMVRDSRKQDFLRRFEGISSYRGWDEIRKAAHSASLPDAMLYG